MFYLLCVPMKIVGGELAHCQHATSSKGISQVANGHVFHSMV